MRKRRPKDWPKRWCVKVTPENAEILNLWRLAHKDIDFAMNLSARKLIENDDYITSDPGQFNTYDGSWNNLRYENYVKIKFVEFVELVLKDHKLYEEILRQTVVAEYLVDEIEEKIKLHNKINKFAKVEFNKLEGELIIF